MIRYQTFFSALADVPGSETADEILLVTAARFCFALRNGAVGFAVCRKIFRALLGFRHRNGIPWRTPDPSSEACWMSIRISQEMASRKRKSFDARLPLTLSQFQLTSPLDGHV